MLDDAVIPTRNNPREIRPGKQIEHPKSVRIFRSSPEEVSLQIRRKLQIIHVTLTQDEAWRVAEALLRAYLDGRGPEQDSKGLIADLAEEVSTWKDRCAAERADHETSISHFERLMQEPAR